MDSLASMVWLLRVIFGDFWGAIEPLSHQICLVHTVSTAATLVPVGFLKSQWGKSRYPAHSNLSPVSKAGFVESMAAPHKVNLRKFCHCIFVSSFQNAPIMERVGQHHGPCAVPLSGHPGPIQKSTVSFYSTFILHPGKTENLQLSLWC